MVYTPSVVWPWPLLTVHPPLSVVMSQYTCLGLPSVDGIYSVCGVTLTFNSLTVHPPLSVFLSQYTCLGLPSVDGIYSICGVTLTFNSLTVHPPLSVFLSQYTCLGLPSVDGIYSVCGVTLTFTYRPSPIISCHITVYLFRISIRVDGLNSICSVTLTFTYRPSPIICCHVAVYLFGISIRVDGIYSICSVTLSFDGTAIKWHRLCMTNDLLYLQCTYIDYKRKRKRSDSVIWQKPLHQQICQKGQMTTQTTPQKSSITERLRTGWGRSVGVTMATQLVWLIWFTGPTFPPPRNSRVIKRTHV